jgi:hypothetical protein
MAFTLELVDWRDSRGQSHPEYRTRDFWSFVGSKTAWQTKAEAEAAAEAAWVEPDCNGVAPVCVVTERPQTA